MYTYETSVKLHDTDAAGLLFFADQFYIAHDAYESFMEDVGMNFARIIKSTDFLVAIIRAEADFKEQLYVGDRLRINIRAEKIGKTSFILAYDIKNVEGDSVGTVRTVHVCIDKEKRKKKRLPDKLRKALETIIK